MSGFGGSVINSDGVLVRTIGPDDVPAVEELHREHYWRSHCLLLNPDFYDWQFRAPSATGSDQSIVAVDRDGRLLSYLGVVPAPASCRGRPLRGAHLITWLSKPEARGRGVGKAVMRHMTEHFDFLFGRSVTPAALGVYQQLGFRYFRNCSRWVAVLDAEPALRLAVEPSDASARRARFRAERTEGASFRTAPTCPSWGESLARTVLADGTSFNRTCDYFAWRYERHPAFRYEYVWPAGVTAGLAVVRVEDVTGREGRVLRVVEFLAAPAHARALARAVFAYGRAQGCAFADAFGMSERFVAGLVAAGAFNAVEEAELRLPHLFQPWDPDLEPPGLLFFGRRDETADGGLGPVDDLARVHVSRGDGNMDWPSWAVAEGSVAPASRLRSAG